MAEPTTQTGEVLEPSSRFSQKVKPLRQHVGRVGANASSRARDLVPAARDFSRRAQTGFGEARARASQKVVPIRSSVQRNLQEVGTQAKDFSRRAESRYQSARVGYGQQGRVSRGTMRYGGGIAQRRLNKAVRQKLVLPIVQKLNAEIARGNDVTAFSIALAIVIFKDFIFDLIVFFIKFIPYVGWFLGPITSIVGGMFLSGFVMIFLMKKGWFRNQGWRILLRIFFWIIVGNFPVAMAIPLDTIIVVITWRRVHKRGAKAKRKLERIERMEEKEARKLRGQFDRNSDYYERYLEA